MGRRMLPPAEVRQTIKFRAQQQILDALTAEAIGEGIPREHLIERIVVDYVERSRKPARSRKRRKRSA